MLSLFNASCASFAQRFTTSPAVLARWSELMSAALDTDGFRSTMHCFIIVLSVMLHSARMAGARYRSSFPVISFVSELVTMITSSAIELSSLMPRSGSSGSSFSINCLNYMCKNGASHQAGVVATLQQLLQLVRKLHAGVRLHIYKARILLVDLLQMPIGTNFRYRADELRDDGILTAHVQIGLQCDRMVDQQLWLNFGEQVQGGNASDEPRVLCTLQAHRRLDQPVHDLLARLDQRFRDFFLHF
uniref:Uncharacterized protein n=1 Tax=Anopheles atroparvus TaxID=41427 RepID=A0A182ITY5_ANOAO